jgi:hypothetical protein
MKKTQVYEWHEHFNDNCVSVALQVTVNFDK